MLQSMTGFGRATGTFANKKVTVEIRSLNSKSTDIYLKTPNSFKTYELPIRKMITEALSRGKIECFITEEPIEGEEDISINADLVKAYYKKLSAIAKDLDEDTSGILPIVMRFSDVFKATESEVSEEEWEGVQGLIKEAIVNISNYRIEEGKTLTADFSNSINEIERLLAKVPTYESSRIELIRERMRQSLDKTTEKIDENRFEQELIYYLEKLDLNEEKTRLQYHIDYFKETMHTSEAIGKKLGFITQEIGREINTIGSKSYHAELQKIVVEMKDNLEKIKEQVFNTL